MRADNDVYFPNLAAVAVAILEKVETHKKLESF